MSKYLFPTLFALSLSIPAFSQAAPLSCSRNGFGAQSMSVMRTGIDTPYTLIATIKTEAKLPDGTTRSGSTTSRQIRDGQGRTRVEDPSLCFVDKDQQTHWVGSVVVTDPVASTYTAWQQAFPSPDRRVSVTHILTTLKMSSPLTPRDEYNLAKRIGSQQVEDLGTRNIVGLQASGFRITRSQTSVIAGNSILLTYVEEKWVSDQYRMILLDIQDDPILGKSIYTVADFNRDEPDTSLFQPPTGYQLEERTVTQ